MHEATQRRLVRATFVLTCLAPTLGVVGWAIAWRLDSHSARLERQLAEQLGLVVRAERVSHPAPKTVRIAAVQLLDPETRERLASLNRVDLSLSSGQLTMTVREATLDAGKTRRLGHLIRTRRSHQAASSSRRITLSCKTLTVVDDSTRIVLHRITGSSQSKLSSVEATCSFAMHDQADAPRVEWKMVRDRRQTPMQTQIDLDTGGLALPVAVLSHTAKQRLGADAVFQGTYRAEYRDGQWHRCVLTGSLDRVQCARWIVEPIPYQLAGQGRLDLQRLDFGPRGIEHAVGTLRIEQGTIDSALLRSLADHRLLTLSNSIDVSEQAAERFSFRDCAIEILMNANGLTIRAPRADVTLTPTPRPIATSEAGDDILQPTDVLPIDRLVYAIVPVDIKDAYYVARRLQQALPRPLPRPPQRRQLAPR